MFLKQKIAKEILQVYGQLKAFVTLKKIDPVPLKYVVQHSACSV